jgi:hypothetical protein
MRADARPPLGGDAHLQWRAVRGRGDREPAGAARRRPGAGGGRRRLQRRHRRAGGAAHPRDPDPPAAEPARSQQAASNLGLREARGEWACFLHQDDLWLPSRLARLRAELPGARGALLLHHARYVDPDGAPLGAWRCPLPAGDLSPDDVLERLLVQNFVAMPSPAFRRAVALEQGGLDERLWFSADWDLWLRLAAAGPVRVLDETLASFRLHPESQTAARPVAAGEWAAQLGTVLDRHLAAWRATGARRRRVERAARASVAVNASLAASARGAPAQFGPLLWQLAALGPGGWQRYLRDSRLVERVGARLRLRRRLAASPRPTPRS